MKNLKSIAAFIAWILIFSLCGCSQIKAEGSEQNDSHFSEEAESSSAITEVCAFNDKLTIFSTWEEAGKFLNMDFSICAEDTRKVHLVDYISDNYNIIQTHFDEDEIFPAPAPSESNEYVKPTLATITAYLAKEGEASEEELHGFADDFSSFSLSPTYDIEFQELRTEIIPVGNTEASFKFYVSNSCNLLNVEVIYKGCLFHMDYENISEEDIDKNIDDIYNSLSNYIQNN